MCESVSICGSDLVAAEGRAKFSGRVLTVFSDQRRTIHRRSAPMTSRFLRTLSSLFVVTACGCEIENAAPPAPSGQVLPGPGTRQAGAVPPGAPSPAAGFAPPQTNPQAPPAAAGAT